MNAKTIISKIKTQGKNSLTIAETRFARLLIRNAWLVRVVVDAKIAPKFFTID